MTRTNNENNIDDVIHSDDDDEVVDDEEEDIDIKAEDDKNYVFEPDTDKDDSSRVEVVYV